MGIMDQIGTFNLFLFSILFFIKIFTKILLKFLVDQH